MVDTICDGDNFDVLHPDVADAVPVFTQAAGAPLTSYAKDPSPSAEAIIVHADSQIRSVADLRGKTVGVSRGSGARFLLAAALKRDGPRPTRQVPAARK